MTACSTVPLQQGKPIQRELDFFDPHFEQEGKRVGHEEVVGYLENHPASRDEMSGYRGLTIGALAVSVSTLVAGLVLYENQLEDEITSWGTTTHRHSSTGLYVILGGAVVSTILQVIAENKLSASVSSYNYSLQSTPPAEPAIPPAKLPTSSYPREGTKFVFLGSGLQLRF